MLITENIPVLELYVVCKGLYYVFGREETKECMKCINERRRSGSHVDDGAVLQTKDYNPILFTSFI